MFALALVFDARSEPVTKKCEREKFLQKKTPLGISTRKKTHVKKFAPSFFQRCARDAPEKFSAVLPAPIGVARPWRPVAMPGNSAAGFQPDGGEQRQPGPGASTNSVDPVARFPAIVPRTEVRATGGARGLPGGTFGGRCAGKTGLASVFQFIATSRFFRYRI